MTKEEQYDFVMSQPGGFMDVVKVVDVLYDHPEIGLYPAKRLNTHAAQFLAKKYGPPFTVAGFERMVKDYVAIRNEYGEKPKRSRR